LDNFSYLVVFFSIYSFLGWIVESGYRSIVIEKKFINSGFLHGPFIPIYGFGAISIYLIWKFINGIFFPLQILILTVIITSFEYISSFILEKIFSIKLWDYSNEKFNLKGRICLLFAFYWAILITIDLLLVQPSVIFLIDMTESIFRMIFCALFLAYLCIDTFMSSRVYFMFATVLRSVQDFVKNGVKFRNPAFFSKIKFNIETDRFLFALRKLPNLSELWNKNWKSFSPEGIPMTMKWINNFFNRKTGGKWIEDHKAYEKDAGFMELIKDIINNPNYQELKNFRHHDNSIYHHSLQVAWLSYKLGKIFKLNLKELVRGAMLHDFFLYDWRTEKPQSGKLHAFEHPLEAFANSQKYFSPLSPIEKDIILKHMWPLTIKPPRYFESLIVCIVDKIVATGEFSAELAGIIKQGKNRQDD
jgi:uncharacterized membrane protein